MKTKYLPFIVGTAALFNLGLNFILIPRYGMMGAATVTFFSYLLMVTITYYLAQRLYFIKYEIRKMFLLFAVATALYFATLPFDSLAFWSRILMKGAIWMLYPFILFLFHFYEPVELARIKGSIKKWTGKIQNAFE